MIQSIAPWESTPIHLTFSSELHKFWQCKVEDENELSHYEIIQTDDPNLMIDTFIISAFVSFKIILIFFRLINLAVPFVMIKRVKYENLFHFMCKNVQVIIKLLL